MNYSSKHAELEIFQERITSQIGRDNFSTLATPVTDIVSANRKVRHADSLVLALNPAITDTTAQLSYLNALTNRQKDTCEAYWYHPDHLGSSSWITYTDGSAVQHLHYLPWGEDFVDQRTTNWHAMHTFSAKEKDSETGLSYFGSRYYSSDLSIWLSVDPMSDKYPSLSPYTYCADNPVKLVDPEGEEFEEGKPPGRISTFLNDLDRKIVGSSENRKGEGHSDGANRGIITNQDVEVGFAVTTAILSAGTAVAAEGALDVAIAVASTANSIDDATINSSGQTASQRVTEKNSTANKTVNASKTLVSAGSAMNSGSKVVTTVKNSLKQGSQVIKKEAVKFAENMVNTASSGCSFVKSIFKKVKK